jgi:PIN domain nuclease of toxin-antitoxin system
MRYLLDTHILVWLITDDKQLKPAIETILYDEQNEFYVSLESLREMVIKTKLNKGAFLLPQGFTISDIATLLTSTLRIKLLGQTLAHIQRLEALKPEHNDPFDHLLICQAIEERLIMISHDGKFPHYRQQGLDLLAA